MTTTASRILRVGTRASPLALAQARLVIAALTAHHPDLAFDIVEITTSGDRIQDRALIEAGGKGLFTKEIEEALIENRIDLAVHSMKDMPTQLPDGLIIAALLPREDARDAFFSLLKKADGTPCGLMDLPAGSVVGTASLRRQSIVRHLRPDLKVEVLRGNVGTRLKKMNDGIVDATMLALAGLKRLKAVEGIAEIIAPEVMLPAVAQGAIGIEVRADDKALRDLLVSVHCNITELSVVAERTFLAVMDGSCRTPIAAHMAVPDPMHRARLDVMVARPDGSDVRRESFMMEVRHAGDAQRLGEHAGQSLRAKLPPDYFG